MGNAKEWFNRFSTLDSAPNESSFAYFIQHALDQGDLNEAQIWLDLMQKHDITIVLLKLMLRRNCCQV